MSKKDKLKHRLIGKPKDFTFNELVTLLSMFGYEPITMGKTSGSRVTFANADNDFIRVHKPHPRNVLKPYQILGVIHALTERGHL